MSGVALLVDTVKLFHSEGPDHYQPRSFPVLDVFEIGANQRTRLI